MKSAIDIFNSLFVDHPLAQSFDQSIENISPIHLTAKEIIIGFALAGALYAGAKVGGPGSDADMVFKWCEDLPHKPHKAIEALKKYFTSAPESASASASDHTHDGYYGHFLSYWGRATSPLHIMYTLEPTYNYLASGCDPDSLSPWTQWLVGISDDHQHVDIVG
jgi:hypothetical protein